MSRTVPVTLSRIFPVNVAPVRFSGVEGLVYDNFTSDNIVNTEPDREWPFEIAIDDGYIDPRATLFIQRIEGGDILVFDELYETKTLEEDSIEHIKQKCERWGMALPRQAVASHEAVALRQRVTAASIYCRNWLEEKAGGNKSTRLAAITLTRGLICDANTHRAIKIHRRCKHLLDEIRSGYKYPDGKHGLETFPEDGHDHALI